MIKHNGNYWSFQWWKPIKKGERLIHDIVVVEAKKPIDGVYQSVFSG